MRVMVFFDLPTETTENRKEYARFRRSLIKSGFIMMQESVYCRMLINQQAGQMVINTIRQNRPLHGIVQVMMITEKQFSKIEMITGSYQTEVLTGDERLVFI